ncbi:DUF1285 domain-containing protein [Moraxella oblonga]|uniref:DUF1285 domain-containing protein n=1 Tax=Moraxella oblonga TaxID=200413 RepID=UPI000A58D512|nr:DUF1285 domain-containing protein [Moraxella oblonga]
MCHDILKNNCKNNGLNEFLVSLVGERKIPPLDKWSPTTVVPFDIIIKDDGDWYHEGVKMTRQSLVDLFASVLWAEGEGEQKCHFLKTPTDKYQITVVDVPLFINQVDKIIENGDEWIVFTTTHGDKIVLDDNLMYFKEFIRDDVCERRLYIDTRFNLTARINRNVFYHLVALGKLDEVDNQVILTLRSGGRIHHLVDNLE